MILLRCVSPKLCSVLTLSLAAEFNPSITKKGAVANSPMLPANCCFTHHLRADLALTMFISSQCIFISNSYIAAGWMVIHHLAQALATQ